MKNIITAIACIIVLSVFMVQFTTNQVIQSKMLYVEREIDTFIENAKQDGCVTETNANNLAAKIAERVGCELGEVTVTGTDTKMERGSICTYTVSYPLKKVIGANKVLGVEDEHNVSNQVISGTFASEYVTWE